MMDGPVPPSQWQGLWADDTLGNPRLDTREDRSKRARAWPRGRGALAIATVGLFVTGVLAAFAVPQPEGNEGPNLIAHAVDLAEEAGSARVSLRFVVEGPGPIPPEFQGSFGGEGVMSLTDARAQMTLIAEPGDGTPAEEIEFRMVGTTMYMRWPSFTEETGFETEWISTDFSELTGLSEAELFGTDLAGGDVTQELQSLRGAPDDMEELGREDVRGVPTTRYRAVVDAADALDEMPAEGREFFEQSLDQMREQFGTTEFPVDAWIDHDGLPRRVRFEYDMSKEESLSAGTVMAMTMEFYDFGVEVDVEPPPQGDVLDLTDMLRQGYGLD